MDLSTDGSLFGKKLSAPYVEMMQFHQLFHQFRIKSK